MQTEPKPKELVLAQQRYELLVGDPITIIDTKFPQRGTIFRLSRSDLRYARQILRNLNTGLPR